MDLCFNKCFQQRIMILYLFLCSLAANECASICMAPDLFLTPAWPPSQCYKSSIVRGTVQVSEVGETMGNMGIRHGTDTGDQGTLS